MLIGLMTIICAARPGQGLLNDADPIWNALLKYVCSCKIKQGKNCNVMHQLLIELEAAMALVCLGQAFFRRRPTVQGSVTLIALLHSKALHQIV